MATPEIQSFVELRLVRVVLREHSDQQWIFLEEASPTGGQEPRGFPIVIGSGEAGEIHRVLTDLDTPRPLTHQLTVDAIQALGGQILGADIVDLRANTFYARLRLKPGAYSAPPVQDGDPEPAGSTPETAAGEIAVDARPSDAVALALRHGAQIRVAESLLEQVRTDNATDALPPEEGDEEDGGDSQGDSAGDVEL